MLVLLSPSLGKTFANVKAANADKDLPAGSGFTLRWNKLKLGKMAFSVEGTESQTWQISGKTLGPLKLVKNYAGVATQIFQKQQATYRLEGNNSGFTEHREIIFRHDELPVITSFNEKETQTGLIPEMPWALSAASPMSLFKRITESLQQNSLCSDTHTIYDGKRRYEVLLEGGGLGEKTRRSLDLSKAAASRYFLCTASMKAASIEEVARSDVFDDPRSGSRANAEPKPEKKSRSGWSRAWLFGADDRTMDFVLTADCGPVNLAGFVLSTPFGPVVGRAAQPCQTGQ